MESGPLRTIRWVIVSDDRRGAGSPSQVRVALKITAKYQGPCFESALDNSSGFIARSHE